MTEPVKCDCRYPECTTCNPPDPDPTAAELARVVAWLYARADAKLIHLTAKSEELRRLHGADEYREIMILTRNIAAELRNAAAALARGEQP